MNKFVSLILLIFSGHTLLAKDYKLYNKIQVNSGILFDIEQDTKTGLYWIASENGILTYNGTEFNRSDIVPANKSVISIKKVNEIIYFILKEGVIGAHDLGNNKTTYFSNGLSMSYDKINTLSFCKGANIENQLIIKSDSAYHKIVFKKTSYLLETMQEKDCRSLLSEFHDYQERSKVLNFYKYNQGTYCYTSNELLYISRDKTAHVIDLFNNFTSILVDLEDNLLLTNYSGYIYIYKKDDIRLEFQTDRIIRRATFTSPNTFYFSDENFSLFQIKDNVSKTIFNNTQRKIVDDRIFYVKNKIFFNHMVFEKNKLIENMESMVGFDTFISSGQIAHVGTGYADIKILRNGKIYRQYTETPDGSNFFYKKITDLKVIGDKIYFSNKTGLYSISFEFKDRLIISNNTKIFKDAFINNLRKHKHHLYFTSNKSDLYILDVKDNGYKLIFKGNDYGINVINAMEILNDSFIFLASDKGVFEIHIDKGSRLIYIRKVNEAASNSFESANDINISGRRLYFIIYNSVYSEPISWHHEGSFMKGKLIFELVNSNLIYNSEEKTYEISGADRNLKIKFHKPSFNDKHSIEKHRAILIHDGDTINSIEIDGNLIDYENLKAGEYTLLFYTRNESGQYQMNKSIDFYIVPFYFETTFFRFLLLTIALLIVILIVGYFNVRLKNRLMKAENENYNLKLLKSQLRPHFLYNTLNTLKSVVYHQKNELALQLIDKFTMFLRHNLSIDNILETDLECELKEIENYLEIENFRTNDRIRFSYSIRGLEKAIIPSNILQPIVENAILHGLKDKLPLTIHLDAYKLPGLLELRITNDGKPLKHKPEEPSKSYALKSIESRINTFNKFKIRDSFLLENKNKNGEIFVEYRLKLKLKIK